MGPWYWKYRKLFDSSTTERQTKFARVSCVIYKWMYAKIYNEILKVEYDFDSSTWMSLVLLSISWKFKIPRFGKDWISMYFERSFSYSSDHSFP